MNESNVNCKDVMTHICDNLGEDLNSDRCVSIKSHLENCRGCQNYFHSVEDTIGFYRAYNEEVTVDCHKRLMNFLNLPD